MPRVLTHAAHHTDVSTLLSTMLGERPSIFAAYDAPTDGTTAAQSYLQNSIDDMITAGGGAIYIPGGYPLNIVSGLVIDNGDVPITLVGDGYSSKLYRSANVTSGNGLIDIRGNNVSLIDFLIDGAVTTPTGLLYTTDFSDPIDAILADNTSIRIKPGCKNYRIERLSIEHTGGYVVLIDADTADVEDGEISFCRFRNNRPHLFGTSSGDKNYGSWTGGILWRADCRASASKLFSVKNLSIHDNYFKRSTGNQVWGHAEGVVATDEQHTNINVDDNEFEDIGLDAMLLGAVRGGGCRGNTGRRIGYITKTDNDTPDPRYLSGLFATFLDGGHGDSLEYTDNSVVSCNGDAYDLDGHKHSVCSGNSAINPLAGSQEYIEDDGAHWGPAHNGVLPSIGINCGNSQQDGGSQFNVIESNVIYNMGYVAIVLGFAKFGRCSDNVIFHPSSATNAPIVLLSSTGGSGDEWLCHDEVVEDNIVDYSGSHAIVEEQGTGWLSSHINRVFGNKGAGSAVEFLPDSASGSYQGFDLGESFLHMRPGASGYVQMVLKQQSGQGTTVPFKLLSSANVVLFQIDATGVASAVQFKGTAAGSSIAFTNTAGSFLVDGNGNIASTSTSTAALGATNGGVTVRYLIGTTSLSLTEDTFAHAGSSTAGNCRAYMDSTSHVLQWSVNGGGYNWLQDSGGNVASLSTSTAAIQAASGGVTAKWLITTESLFFIEGTLPAVSVSGQAKIAMKSSDHVVYISVNGGAFTPLLSGGGTVGGSNTQVLFNDSGTENGDAGLIFVKGTGTLTATVLVGAAAGGSTAIRNSGSSFLVDGNGNVASTSSSTAALQAANGGVTVKWLIATDSLFFLQESAPSNSAAGQARMYMDSGSAFVRLSTNTGAYSTLLTVGGVIASTGISVSGTNTVTITNTGVTSLGGSTGALNLVGGTGVSISTLTISIGQAVGTGNNVTFANVTTPGVFQALPPTAGTITFQVNRSSTDWTLIDGQGNISTVATVACKAVNLDYQSNGGVLSMRGTTIINNSATFVGAGVATGASGIGGGGFSVWNGSGYDAGVTAGPMAVASITVKGGIVTAIS